MLATAVVGPLVIHHASLGAFWSPQLIIAVVLNGALQALQIGAYAARVAGVQTGRIGTSISLFNLIVTASRFANMFYAPMLGTISDRAGRIVLDPALAGPEADVFAWQMRAIVLAGTIGTALGAFFLPTFVYLFVRGVAAFEKRGSIPSALARLLDPKVIGDILRSVQIPSLATYRQFKLADVPAKLLVGNVLVTGIYAIGVVASFYASVLMPQVTRTALSASGLVNGIATIAFALIVDPTSAYIVDQANKGERPPDHVRSMVHFLAVTAIVGTLFSQVLLYPAALLIGHAAQLVNSLR